MTYEECKQKYKNYYKILSDDGDYLIMYRIYGDKFHGKELELIKFNRDTDNEENKIMLVAEEVEKLKLELWNN